MASKEPRPSRNVLPILIVALAIVAIVLVVAGRVIDRGQFNGWQDPFYSVLLAFTLDGSFLGTQSPITLMGAFAAGAVLYLAVLGGLWTVFHRNIRVWRAARLRDHVVLVGDTPDALELAETLAQTTAVILAGETEFHRRRLTGIQRPGTVAALMAAANAERARSVVVMLADEKLNAAIATSIANGREGADTPTIWCRVGDRLVADRVAGVESGAARILVFDEAQMMARDLFARHPAHSVAERMAADRVHVLVVGFGRLGQAAAEEAVFSGIAAGFAPPMITIVDRQARAMEAIYRQSRPALDKAADFAIIEADLIMAENAPAFSAEALAALAARDDVARVTGIVICLGSETDNIRFALALPDIRRREGRYFAPAFMRVREADAESIVFSDVEPRLLDPVNRVVPLQRPTALIVSDILDAAHRDQAARRLHDAYSRGPGQSAGASSDWNHLPETYRRANRRSADHLTAKLFSLGLASEHDAHEPVMIERQAHERYVAPLFDDDAAPVIGRLAALEHRRWSADRVIDGWSHGPVRDDDRKVHPLLERADYDALPAVEQNKDREQVRTLLQALVPVANKGAMPELRVALAGHRNLDRNEETRAARDMVARLLPRLALAQQIVTLVSPLAPGADIVLTEALATALAGKTGGLRLIVPEAVPYAVVLETVAAESAVPDPLFVERALARRKALFSRFERIDIVRIGFSGVTDYSYKRDKAQFERGLQRANAYLARRCDMLAALWDGAPARGPGGTGELVQFWRDPQAIPAEIDPGPSPVRPTPPDREAALVVTPVTRSSIVA